MTTITKINLLMLTILILSTGCIAATLDKGPNAVGTAIHAGCCVTGTVYDNTGKPAARAVVTLEDEDGNQSVVRSDSKGEFRLDGIVPGAVYHIDVKHPEGIYQASIRSFLPGDHIEIRAASPKKKQ
jgi:protocatechuate 3,4-dioxygenase beta subunit